MRLDALQQTMFRAVAGEGDLETTAALVKGGALTREDRVGLYAEMYWLRMRDSLRTDYPFVHRVMGDAGFDVLVARHVRRRPSTHYSLGRLGADFERTVREAGANVPAWLADLAALEWARDEAFVAVDGPVLDLPSLAALSDETFPHARLVATSAVRLLRPGFDVLPVWRALEAGEAWSELSVERAAAAVVVWRQGFQVFHVAVGDPEAKALESVLAGLDLPTVCEAFADAAEPVQVAFQAMASWVNEGMLAALEVDPS